MGQIAVRRRTENQRRKPGLNAKEVYIPKTPAVAVIIGVKPPSGC